MRHRLVLPATILAAFMSLFAAAAAAQIPAITEETQTPSPGSGHEYIQWLNETVNPSNGAVTININVPMPKERQLPVPFHITYNSGQAITGPGLNFVPTIGSEFSAAGWSYTVPMFNYMYGYYDDPDYGECDFTTDYVYYDANGNATSTGVAEVDTGSESCIVNGYSTIDPVQNGPNLATGYGVTDADGTVYSITAGGGDANNGTDFAALASLIEDRNGNQVHITYPGYTGQFTYTDTMGRTVLSSSGFGSGTTSLISSKFNTPYYISWGTASYNYTLNFEDYNYFSWEIPYCGSGNHSTTAHGSMQVIQSIQMPNGQSYTFTYDPNYGRISKITYPSGAYTRYVWGIRPQATYFAYPYAYNDYTYGVSCDRFYDEPVVTDRYVSPDGVTETEHQNFTYTPCFPNYTGTTTLADTDLTTNQTIQTVQYNYVLGGGSGGGGPYDPFSWGSPTFNESSIVYQSGSQTLRTVNKTWYGSDPLKLASQKTMLEDGSTASETDWCYNSFYQVIEKDDSDYSSAGPGAATCNTTQYTPATAPGPLLLKTVMSYASFGSWGPYNTYWSGQWINDRPASVITYDGSNNRVAETDYSYGNTTSGVTATSHDDVGYSPSSTLNRGNLMSETKQCFPGCGNATTSFTYDETGQALTQTDPKGNITTYSYTDCFASGTGTAPGATDGYLTMITDAMGHTESFCYGYDDGTLRSSTDQNVQTTSYSYSDPLDRLTMATYPSTGETQYSYHDAAPMSTTVTKLIGNGVSPLVQTTTLDGFGREIRSDTTNGESVPYDETDTCYDGIGRVSFKSFPYQTSSFSGATCSNSVTPGDSYAYDSLNRPTSVTHSDGSSVLTSYTLRATSDQDEGNGTQRVQRISQADGLGRLTSVCEVTGTTLPVGISGSTAPINCGLDSSGNGFLTTYVYSALDNLTSVTQGPLNARSFAYDSLSRLTNATNPESGTTSYTYDADSNVVTKTDARGITICYGTWTGTSCNGATGYDAVNHLLTKTYSDGITPAVAFNYSETSSHGVSLVNTIGRLSSESTAGSNPTGSVFSYDPMGRVSNNSQCTPQNCSTTTFSVAYTYDLLGDVLTSNNGAGVTLTNTYNSGARLTTMASSLSDSNHPSVLFGSSSLAHYNAAGSLVSVLFGNALCESRSYDGRLRLTAISDGTGTSCSTGPIYSLSLTGGYAPNSDVVSANDSVNGNWTYSYDPFNRLTIATQSSQPAYTYAYDRYGNRWNDYFNGSCTAGPTSCLTFDTNNHINNGAQTYDAAGNGLSDSMHFYFYDGEGRLTQVDGGALGNCSAATACYVYDAGGRRVRKTTSGASVDFIYNLAGAEISQFTSGGVWNRGEVYAGRRHLATYIGGTGGTTSFIYADWLGTERVRAPYPSGTPETCTSLPFGDDLICSGTDVSPMHFTGKEHDSESNLDNFGARYDSSALGRFMSPDALNTLDISHPQKLNRYAYATNNPLSNIDVGGHCTAPAVSGGQVGICVESYIRTFLLPGVRGKFAFGDDRGPNPHGGTFRTQTLLIVDPSSHDVSLVGDPAAGRSCAIPLGCFLGVNHSSLSKISHDDKGNTYFTLTVYGENGYEADRIPGAPGGWIEMQFAFKVNSKGEVTVLTPSTKGYPSVSIYSYDSAGDDQHLFEQTESGHLQDLWWPMKPATNEISNPFEDDMARQCLLGNPAACD